MQSVKIRPHIILLCVITVYLSTVEGSNTNREDDSFSDIDRKVANLLQLSKKRLSGKSRRFQQKTNELTKLVKLIDMIYHSDEGKGDLRDDSFTPVRNFLDKLNNLISKNTHKDYYEKKDNCQFGFGPPGSCKRNKFRRLSSSGFIRRRPKGKRDKLDYANHMLVERAEYSSSSAESVSDENTQNQITKKKSRFVIVNNKKKSKQQPKGRFEDQDSNEMTIQMENTDDSAELSSEELPRIVNDDTGSDEAPKKISEEVSDDPDSREKGKDENILYLQGTRLQKPNARAHQRSKRSRRDYRMSYFLPKRYKWHDNMLTHLDNYWQNGIRAYDTYRHKYRPHMS